MLIAGGHAGALISAIRTLGRLKIRYSLALVHWCYRSAVKTHSRAPELRLSNGMTCSLNDARESGCYTGTDVEIVLVVGRHWHGGGSTTARFVSDSRADAFGHRSNRGRLVFLGRSVRSCLVFIR